LTGGSLARKGACLLSNKRNGSTKNGKAARGGEGSENQLEGRGTVAAAPNRWRGDLGSDVKIHMQKVWRI